MIPIDPRNIPIFEDGVVCQINCILDIKIHVDVVSYGGDMICFHGDSGNGNTCMHLQCFAMGINDKAYYWEKEN